MLHRRAPSMATREGLADAGGAKFQICLASLSLGWLNDAEFEVFGADPLQAGERIDRALHAGRATVSPLRSIRCTLDPPRLNHFAFCANVPCMTSTGSSFCIWVSRKQI
jgi:hypothetical protein